MNARSPLTTSALLSLTFGVVVAVCLAVLGYTVLTGDDGDGSDAPAAGPPGSTATDAQGGTGADDAAVRDLVAAQADQFLLRVNTYGPEDLAEDGTMPDYAESVREVITPEFAVGFENNLTLAEQTVSSDTAYERSVRLFATGVENVSDGRAQVLVAGEITASIANPRTGERSPVEPLPFRYRVEVAEVDGRWLVDDFTAVTGESEPGLGTPTGQGQPGQTGQPGQPGQQGGSGS